MIHMDNLKLGPTAQKVDQVKVVGTNMQAATEGSDTKDNQRTYYADAA